MKKQVANTVKSLCAPTGSSHWANTVATCLYNISLEVEAKLAVVSLNGFVYSATDGLGNKVGNPFKASKIDKSVSVEAIEKTRLRFSTRGGKETLRDDPS